MKRHDHWIGGAYTSSADQEYVPTLDPMTGEPWAEIARGGSPDVDAAVTSAMEAFPAWRLAGPTARAETLWRLGDLLFEEAEQLAALESRDAGKVIREVVGQIRALRSWYHYYASCAFHMEGRQIPHDRGSLLVVTTREPYGVIGVIPPFNSPLLLGSMAIGPALAAGNTVVVKPPEINSLALLRLGELAQRAGIPDGCVNVVLGFGSEAGDAIVRHPGVRKVFFTGGPISAKHVLQSAAPGLKPTTLELGGKSANIFFDDIDVAKVVNGVIAGIFAAAGQTCVAGSRLLVQSSVADELISRVVERAGNIILGDPRDERTEMGPLSQLKLLDGAVRRIKDARARGAEILSGGPDADVPLQGWFLAPTVMDSVTADMDVVREEIFGPVLSILRFDEEDEAIAMANDTEYGLAAGVWTNNLGRGHRVARALEAGTVWVNTYRALNYAVPFGGSKASGFGRENGMDGFLEFTEPKAIWFEASSEPVGDPFTLRT
jgi:acyl-CoA reductase-like NAD-dependent aldehyde dehydrogenase